MLGCQPSTLTQRSMHHQKSSSDSPFHANTLKPREGRSTFYRSLRRGRTNPWAATPHLPPPGPPPLRSEWSRCCTPPICTEPPGPTASPSAPGETEERQACVAWSGLRDAAERRRLTAVCAVMWVQPTTLAPARGFSPWARFRRAIRAGISERRRPISRLVITHVQIHVDTSRRSCECLALLYLARRSRSLGDRSRPA